MGEPISSGRLRHCQEEREIARRNQRTKIRMAARRKLRGPFRAVRFQVFDGYSALRRTVRRVERGPISTELRAFRQWCRPGGSGATVPTIKVKPPNYHILMDALSASHAAGARPAEPAFLKLYQGIRKNVAIGG